ncbi:MAG TPA: ATPase [Rhodobacteraceae bacterium]|nr:ATPase [Paracoccaceae bacterium]
MCAGLTPSVIAIDGGGTRCRLVLDRADGRLTAETGPANVATDFDAALGEIRRGLDLLADKAGMTAGEIAALPAYLGLAGASDRALCARVAAALPFAFVRVEEDRAAALQGALGDVDGAIAHCGTGSFFGLRQGGTARFIGGWGARLGDEASSFWVGRMALTGTLAAVDGLRSPSALSDALLARWHTPGGLVGFANRAIPGAIGEIAPEVAAAARAGDALGREVMLAGATHVADMLGRIGWQPGLAISFTGGLAPTYAPYLPQSMQAALVEAKAPPIEGAIALARAFALEAGA